MGTLSIFNKSYKSTFKKNLSLITTITLSALAFLLVAVLHQSSAWATWKQYGLTKNNDRNPASSVGPAEVNDLEVKWSIPTELSIIKGPAIENDTVYLLDYIGNIYKLDKNTGADLWPGGGPLNANFIISTCPVNNNPSKIIKDGSPVPLYPQSEKDAMDEHFGFGFTEEGEVFIKDFLLEFDVRLTLVGNNLLVAGNPIIPEPGDGGLGNTDYFLDSSEEHGRGEYFQDFPYGTGYVLIMDKTTGECVSLSRVGNNPYEAPLGSPTCHNNHCFFGISGYEESGSEILQALTGKPHKFTSIGRLVSLDPRDGTMQWSEPMVDPFGDPSDPSDDLPVHYITGSPSCEADPVNCDPDYPEGIVATTGATVWQSAPVVDPSEKLVYITTGNAYTGDKKIIAPEDEEGEPLPSLVNDFHVAVNAFLALDFYTGEKKWVTSVDPDDYWYTLCIFGGIGEVEGGIECGPDYDFSTMGTYIGNVPNVYGIEVENKTPQNIDLLIAPNKSGITYAVEAKTGQLVYDIQTAPSSIASLGGNAYDHDSGLFIQTNSNFLDYADAPYLFPYIDPETNPAGAVSSQAWTLINPGAPYEAGDVVHGGIVTAMEPATGDIVWQNASPAGRCEPLYNFIFAELFGEVDPTVTTQLFGTYWAPPTVSNGVVYTGDFTIPLNLVVLALDPIFGPVLDEILGIPHVFMADTAGDFVFDLAGYCPEQNNTMHTFNAQTGAYIRGFADIQNVDIGEIVGLGFPYEVPLPHPVIQGATVDGDMVFWGTSGPFIFGPSTFYAFGPPDEE